MQARTVLGWAAAATAMTVSAGLVVAGVAGAATGGGFMLGRHNSETATSSLKNTAGSPLMLQAPSGIAPLRVNSSVKVAHLNAALVGGVPVNALQRRVNGNCGSGVSSVSSTGLLVCAGNDVVMSASTTWTVPAGVSRVLIEAIGGGGGGAAGKKGTAGGGGAGADVTDQVAVTPGEILDVVIGRGGVGGTSSAAAIAGSPTDVFRQSHSGALLVDARGGSGGRAGGSAECASGSGGRPAALGVDGVIPVSGLVGAIGSCPSGGGAAGYPGSGGSPSHGGVSGHAGVAGDVLITLGG